VDLPIIRPWIAERGSAAWSEPNRRWSAIVKHTDKCHRVAVESRLSGGSRMHRVGPLAVGGWEELIPVARTGRETRYTLPTSRVLKLRRDRELHFRATRRVGLMSQGALEDSQSRIREIAHANAKT